MIGSMGVEITTGAKVKGPAWAKRNPEKATEIWVRGQYQGKRIRERIGPDTPENREKAQQRVGRIETAMEMIRGAGAGLCGPVFEEAARDYLRVGTKIYGLADTTCEDRRFQLAKDGPICSVVGMRPMDAITTADWLRWWEDFIVESDRTVKTGRNYLDAVSGVYTLAIDRGHVTENPIDGLRAILRRSGRTKQARAQAMPEPTPLQSHAAIERFVAVSSEWATRGLPDRKVTQRERLMFEDIHVINLLMLDAGLREGEALGLRWGSIGWGRGKPHEGRHLLIADNLARGKFAGDPKSGRSRKVAMSRRLRAVLKARELQRGRPGPDARVVVRRDAKRYRAQFVRICRPDAANVGDRTPKDLRDTFACYLLMAGISLGYIAEQLGHAHPQVTARHYARWVGDDYRTPMELRPNEVPADLLARLDVATVVNQ